MARFADISLFSTTALTAMSELPFEHLGSGKVRELYAWDEDFLFFVATDRLSAFDVVMAEGVPGKGEILTQMSRFWFDQMAGAVDSHIVPDDEVPESWLACLEKYPELRLRSMFVRRVQPLAFEFVVRGYLSGSGWKAYQKEQAICGFSLPEGLVESSKLPEPILTPTTKANEGHDEPVSHEVCIHALGEADFAFLRDTSISIFEKASAYAASKGIILADTKFEFGRASDGQLVLIDEIFTPDSARYWPAEAYTPGKAQLSYDKQFVRDWLGTLDWDKQPPAPALPESIISGTRARYLEAYSQLVG